jgi:hypothetical protein
MLALGLNDLPSDRVMDDIDKALQKMCGVESIRYLGKLGHVYYVNDLAGIIAQVCTIFQSLNPLTMLFRKWQIQLFAKIYISFPKTPSHHYHKLGRPVGGLLSSILTLQLP